MTQHNKCYVIFIIITAIAKDTAGTRVPHASSLGVCLFSFSDDQYTSASITTPIRAAHIPKKCAPTARGPAVPQA